GTAMEIVYATGAVEPVRRAKVTSLIRGLTERETGYKSASWSDWRTRPPRARLCAHGRARHHRVQGPATSSTRRGCR
ncbi:MAG: hypothetical protein ACJ8EA_25720, partial [Xanthobacteraceae bacterium]